ncbi:unnamed protein product [Thelazia callipaeda]|uniref:Uncharacterized protein n=1 Tax=Thelazia callipaeda TaxID=103827 RepID=A0A0N5DAC5_THECL|nr:unnamed protein product [Thelazia callipaeda]
MNAPKYSTEAKVSADITTAGSTFGTLQRNQGLEYPSNSNRQLPQNRRPFKQPEAYASIHKSRTGQLGTNLNQRRGSKDDGSVNNGFGTGTHAYGTYATFGRPQTRALQNQQLMQQAAVEAAQAAQANRNVGAVYSRAQQNIVSENGSASSMLTVRNSPGAENRLAMRAAGANREQSPYQRTSHLKLSSFNSTAPSIDSRKMNSIQQQPGSITGSIYSSWSQQRHASQPNDWPNSSSCDKTSVASSSHQEQCFTPSSTLTSQGSMCNYSSQRLPTPGSPNPQNVYSSGQFMRSGATATCSLYGNLGDEYGAPHLEGDDRDRTLKAQQQRKPLRPTVATGNTTIRHQIKGCTSGPRQDDSANHSLTSSNESADNTRNNAHGSRIVDSVEFATSIV